MKIVGIIKPFAPTQNLYVYDEEKLIETVQCTDFNNIESTMLELIDKYPAVNDIDIVGPHSYTGKVKEDMTNLTKFSYHIININLI